MAIDLTDKTSNSNTLTNNGGATEVTTSLPFFPSTSAVDVEQGSTQYLSIADASQTGLDLSTTFTLEGWFKFESLPANLDLVTLIAKGNYGADRGYEWYLYNNGGTYEITGNVIDSGGQSDNYKWNWAVSTGIWYHLALTCDVGNASATTFELFIDGVSQGNGTALVSQNISAIKNTAQPFGIAYGGAHNYFDGQFDDIRVWNDVRTSAEINQYRGIELNGTEANLVAYWPFEATLGGGATFWSDRGGDGSREASSAVWATAHDAASASSDFSRVACSGDIGDYEVGRVFLPFDTSALPDSITIVSAILSLYATDPHSSSETWVVVQSTQANNSSLADADFDQLGTTSGGTILATGISTGAYNDITLNATGRGWISKTGYTPLGLRGLNDINNTAPGAVREDFTINFTTTTPKLVVTYTTESSSVSPSLSPSASGSFSLSPSSSLSPSGSQSPSSSMSASTSPSFSASASGSRSLSPSASSSRSASASPSVGFSNYTRAAEESLPGNDNDLTTVYTNAEEVKVATRNNSRVGQTGSLQYMIHLFKNFVGSETYGLIEWEGQSTLAPKDSTVYLQIYNRNSGIWETIDTDSTSDSQIDFELTGVVTSLTNYKDSSNVISCRVYQLAT